MTFFCQLWTGKIVFLFYISIWIDSFIKASKCWGFSAIQMRWGLNFQKKWAPMWEDSHSLLRVVFIWHYSCCCLQCVSKAEISPRVNDSNTSATCFTLSVGINEMYAVHYVNLRSCIVLKNKTFRLRPCLQQVVAIGQIFLLFISNNLRVLIG